MGNGQNTNGQRTNTNRENVHIDKCKYAFGQIYTTGQMKKSTNGQISKLTSRNEQLHKWRNQWIAQRAMDKWTNGEKEVQSTGLMDQWTIEQIDRGTDE